MSGDARANQAMALIQQGKLEQARTLVQRSMGAESSRAEWPDLMRTILSRMGQPQQALYFAEKTVALAPGHAGVLGELGLLQYQLGKTEQAIGTMRRVMELEPAFASARCALLAMLISEHRLGEAEPIAQAGLAIDPHHDELNMKLGAIEMETLRMREAFDRLVAMRFRHGGSQLTHERLVEYQATLANYAGLYPDDSVEPLTPSRIGALHREAAQVLQGVASPKRPAPARVRTAGQPLRVAILSPDLRRHPVAFFIEPFLKHADRSRIELIAVSTGSSDAVTARLKPLFAHWHDLPGAANPQINDAIRSAKPDVLVELAGFTASQMLGALVDRPAPVQATYLGYPNTTGCRFIDYRIVDSITDPPGPLSDGLCAEKLIRIDPCFLCYSIPSDMPAATARPDGPVTFCCFNRLQKISRQTLSMWAEILRRVPRSRLVFKDGQLKDGPTLAIIQRELARWGVDPARVELLSMTATLPEHWQAFNRCHIALDAYPYHGTTTTCEALAMGTPVVTLAGPTHVARVGASILTAAGAPELIAKTPDEYIQLAIDLASDRSRLAHYHATLAGRFRAGPICDEPGFADRLTTALERMAASVETHSHHA
ncbi:MAG: tetratricopeptide repeat protein [Phycisphaerales bacterium]